MTKPVDEEEMILRIRALLRRAQIVNERRITIADVCLDYDSLTVSRGDESQTLPRKEFYLLYKLLSYPGKIFTRIQLMDEIWGMDPSRTTIPSMYTLTGFASVLRIIPSLPLKPYAAWATRR